MKEVLNDTEYLRANLDKILRIIELKYDYETLHQAWLICKVLKDYDTMITELLPKISISMSDESKKLETREKYRELRRNVVFSCARDKVDMFWQAMEYEREYSKSFYLPRRIQLSPIIKAHQRLLDGKDKVLTVSQPSGTGKSTLMLGFVLMKAGNNPDKSIIMSAYGAQLCKAFTRGLIEFMTSQEYNYKEIFPEVKDIYTDMEALTIDINKKGRYPTLTACSIDASIVGRTRAQGLLVMDDMVQNIEEAMNENRLDTLWQKITDDLIGRTEGNCQILAQGTHYSVRDPLQRLKDAYGKDCFTIRIPGLNEHNQSNFMFDCENRYTTEYYLNRKRMMKPEEFMTQVQQEPVERQGMLFIETELKRFDYLSVDKKPDAIIAVCDTKTTGDNYFTMPIAAIYDNNAYIIDCIYSNTNTNLIIPRAAQKLIDHGVSVVRVESNNAGSVLCDNLEKEVRARGGYTTFIKVHNQTNKAVRIWGAHGNIMNNIYFLNQFIYDTNVDINISTDLKEEILKQHPHLDKAMYRDLMQDMYKYSHNGKNKYDDAPDSIAMVTEFMKKQIKPIVKTLRW